MKNVLRSAALAACAIAALAAALKPAVAQSSTSRQNFQGAYVGIAPLYAWAKSDVTLSRPGFADVSGGVLGVAADLGIAKFSSTKAAPIGAIRARLGQTVAPDVLVYATGGRVFAQQSLSGTLGGTAYDVSKTVGGWTYGAGLEKQTAIGAQPVRLGLEVLRFDLSKFEFDAGTRHVAISNSVWTVGARAALPLQ
jgi:opacity protein-like surface antigen